MGKSPGSCTTNCLTVFMPVMTSTKFGQLRSVRQSTETDWNHWLTPPFKDHSAEYLAQLLEGVSLWWSWVCTLVGPLQSIVVIDINQSLLFITSLTLPSILMMGVHLGGALKSYCHYHYNYCQYICICAIKSTYQQMHLCKKMIASKAFSHS